MPPTTIRSPPAAGDYMSLADYQSQTPESFTDGKPILHLNIAGVKASIPRSQCGSLAVFPAEAGGAERSGGDKEEIADEPMAEEKLDILVTSENFIVFNQRTDSGVSIPYPAISIHALKKLGDLHAVWMQLDFADTSSTDDDAFSTIELTLLPPDIPDGPTAAQLFDAISACSDLHPDPNNEEDEDEDDRIIIEGGGEHEAEAVEGFTGVLRGTADGGLPPPLPGSGGWITAENMHEYFDEEGNWIGGGGDEPLELGEGAGRTRDRDELEGDSVNGRGEAEDTESKRPRVE